MKVNIGSQFLSVPKVLVLAYKVQTEYLKDHVLRYVPAQPLHLGIGPSPGPINC